MQNLVTSSNPNYINGPQLEILYKNMLGSMMLQFMGQVAISQSILADDPEVMTSSPFWPLALTSEGMAAGFEAAVQLLQENAPTGNSDVVLGYYEKMFTILRGAVSNVFDNDAAANDNCLIHLEIAC